ncbi:diacylglycerol kinase [Paracoccus sp. S-4012]|uniref:c-type cytochrome n=1 Tax=Paracoccus sp. S-4012 TaxID=2665648 RepID=UPI0012B0CE20|nr:cytochrome c [Paracoccus sp. S-4012]MRX48934.1 diacylglycerol kinase [Paracoccus sp. S-4012]
MRRLHRFGLILAAAAILAVAILWFLTRPGSVSAAELSGLTADPVRGEYVFHGAGCASCHSAPGAEGEDQLRLGGGQAFVSDFGTFYAPNISPDPEHGIGRWSDADLVNVLLHGIGPEGHLYPAMPYDAYEEMTLNDMVSLRAFMATLPTVASENRAHEVPFPFNIRRALGLWDLMFVRDGWVVTAVPPDAETGRYIAEALAHCGECHTPRNAFGGLQRGAWLSGAPNPAGEGRVPNITPGRLTWSEDEIAAFLRSGFTPDFDTAGAQMAEVVRSLSNLPEEDLRSVARYLKAVPAVE